MTPKSPAGVERSGTPVGRTEMLAEAISMGISSDNGTAQSLLFYSQQHTPTDAPG